MLELGEGQEWWQTRLLLLTAVVMLTVARLWFRFFQPPQPENLLLTEDGSTQVADFGIARAAGARQGLTMPGTVLGTATYLSPEQAQGAEVDFRTDVYSLGMVLYEMLAGKPPFTGDSPVAVAYQQLSQTAPPPSTHNADVPPALDAIVMRAMSKNPDDRQATAGEIREELLQAKLSGVRVEDAATTATGHVAWLTT